MKRNGFIEILNDPLVLATIFLFFYMFIPGVIMVIGGLTIHLSPFLFPGIILTNLSIIIFTILYLIGWREMKINKQRKVY
jgi:hypothetical protein